MPTTPPAPTVTPYATAAPCPRCDVVITLPGDARTVTIWRSYAGVREIVRGAAGTTALGTFAVTDFEAPFQTQITYSATTTDAGGVPSLAGPESTPTTLNVADVWLADPLDPSSSQAVPVTQTAAGVTSTLPLSSMTVNADGTVTVDIPDQLVTVGGGVASVFTLAGSPALPVLKDGSFDTLDYPSAATAVRIAGNAIPVGVGAQRGAIAGVPFIVACYTKTADTAMQAVLNRPFLTVRVPSNKFKYVPPLMHVVPTKVQRQRRGRLEVGSRWLVQFDRILPPGVTVIVPQRTFADIAAEGLTFGELRSKYLTFLDMKLGRSAGG